MGQVSDYPAITSFTDDDLLPVIDDPAATRVFKNVTALNAAYYFGAVKENVQTGTSYTLVLTDRFKAVPRNNASANTLTVPPASSVAWTVGDVIEVVQLGAGTTTVVQGAGVTIQSRGGLLNLAGQYAVAGLRYRGTDVWSLSGDLA